MKKIYTLGTLGIAAAASLVIWQSVSQPNQSLPSGALNAQESAENIDTSSIVEMAQGPEDASVTVIEYASFTCPHCAHFHDDVYPQLKRDYIDTGKIRFIYRDVYFDKFGLWASMLARCGGPTRFFGLSDILFDQQKDWLDGTNAVDIANNLRKIGNVAGLSEEQVNACLDDNTKAKQLVAWYQKNAAKDEISSTPSLIIDGKKYSNMSYSDLKTILDEKISE